MNFQPAQDILSKSAAFEARLSSLKKADASVNWYPYASMNNLQLIQPILPDEMKRSLTEDKLSILDVGAADGDFGYFFESLGHSVDFLDNAPTNFNDCLGIKKMAGHLDSKSNLIERDIDGAFEFPLAKQYDFALALGILYHLRSPLSFLRGLALIAERMVVSTRVATHFGGVAMGDLSAAYLLKSREANDDPTNYWVFTPKGLEMALKRSGWNVRHYHCVGAEHSDPLTPQGDQRMFAYCERVANWRDLPKHHDF
jgi:2-polyprenyl-3-methyl-5-hydroxy-6-metoxy-1,4-benzoquinol methylase